MALETGTYISDLNSSNPAASDSVSVADDHIRLIKATVKATFPNVTGAVTASHSELNILDGVLADAAEINILNGLTATTTELNYVAGVSSKIQNQLNYKEFVSPTISAKTDDFNAAKDYHYILRTNAPKTATLPGSPTSGDTLWITNTSGGDWTAARNSLNIMGAASDLTMVTNTVYQFTYIDSTTGWAVIRGS